MDDPFTRPALIVRRATLENLEEPKERNTEWFQPQDSKTRVAGASCIQVRDIYFSKLSQKEKEAALQDSGPEQLKHCVATIQARYLDKNDRWYSSDRAKMVVDGFVSFANVFGAVLTKISEASSPEYGAAFTIVNFIYKGIKEKSAREEKLSFYLSQIAPKIDIKKFYSEAINTRKMTEAFSAFCASIVKFVIAAEKYCRKVSIVKLIISSTTHDPLQEFYEDVDRHAEAIENLRMAASLALLLDQRSKTEEITKVLVKMYERSIAVTVTPEANAILSLANYKAHSRAQKLVSSLRLPPYDPLREKYYNEAQRIHLPPRDCWENHPSVINFPSWEAISPRPLLWLSGPESSPGVSWVSAFSVDLIDSLSVNDKLVAAYVFCSNDNEDLELTPLVILKRLIASLLSSFPNITISHIAVLSLGRFQYVGSSPFLAWRLLSEILEILQEVMMEQQQELYIIIDRLDICGSSSEDFGVRKDLIPRLQEISQRWRNTRVVITSTAMAERVGTLKGDDGWVWPVWFDSSVALDMGNSNFYDD